MLSTSDLFVFYFFPFKARSVTLTYSCAEYFENFFTAKTIQIVQVLTELLSSATFL